MFNRFIHRVDRVLGFFSCRPNWDPPTPLLAGGGGGMGGPDSDEGTDHETDAVVLQVRYICILSVYPFNHKVLTYTEHHSVCPLVGIGTPPKAPTPLPQAS
jgi:hypothetical protein